MNGDERPRVTVYIPTYNRSGYLSQSVRSILDQTYRDLRLVVSDNASTDDTPEMLARIDDPRLEHRRLPENVGLLANFNACLADASSEYVLLLADDEVLYPEHIAKTVALLDAHPRVGMVHTAFDVIGPDGDIIFPATNWTGSDDPTEPGHEFIRASLASWSRVAASTALMRTEALPEGGFLAEDFPPTDFGLWLRMAADWDIGFLSEALAGYRIHPDSHSAVYGEYTETGYIDTPEHILKGLEVKLRFLDNYGDRFPDREALRAAAQRSARESLINRAARMTVDERKLVPTIRLLADAVRRQPRVALEPPAWKLVAGAVLGRRVVAEIKRRRAG